MPRAVKVREPDHVVGRGSDAVKGADGELSGYTRRIGPAELLTDKWATPNSKEARISSLNACQYLISGK
jgi:hypothetical protein